MPIIPFPRRALRAANWQQTGGRPSLQRSAFTGRTAELADFGPAPRWTAEAEPVPMRYLGDTALAFAGFEAACQVPGNTFRMPRVWGSQHGAAGNLIQNPQFEGGSAPWTLESAWNRISTGAPVDFPQSGLFTENTRPFNNAFANAGVAFPFSAGARLFLGTDLFRSTGSAGTLSIAANFLNSGGGLISTLGLNLVAASTANLWQRAASFVTAPAGTASVLVYYNNGLTTGFAAVSGARAAMLPERATVNGAANAGRSLALSGLALSQRNLRAGQFLTVTLPGGDEQLLRLAADLNGDASGNGTASLATPLRRTPVAGAVVELDQPWALMRAIHTPGEQQRVGGIVQHGLQSEEAF